MTAVAQRQAPQRRLPQAPARQRRTLPPWLLPLLPVVLLIAGLLI